MSFVAVLALIWSACTDDTGNDGRPSSTTTSAPAERPSAFIGSFSTQEELLRVARALATEVMANPSLGPSEFVRICVVVVNVLMARTAQLNGEAVTVLAFGESGEERILVHDSECEQLIDVPL